MESMDHDVHKMRRDAMSGFFTKRSVQALDSLIQDTVETFLTRLKGEMDKPGAEKGHVNLSEAFSGMTLDVISEYCFGEPMGGLTSPVYGKVWLDAIHEGIQIRPLGRHFPWLINTLMDLPPSITAKLNGTIGVINTWLENMQDKVELIMRYDDKSSKEGSRRRTVFHDMRDDTSGKLPPAEKDPKQLGKHAMIFIGAGTETTARTLAVTTYYLMKYPDIGDKLKRELINAVPKDAAEKIPSPQLEALPYLVSEN